MDSAYEFAWTIFFQDLLVFVNYQKLPKQVLCNGYMNFGEVHDLVKARIMDWVNPFEPTRVNLKSRRFKKNKVKAMLFWKKNLSHVGSHSRFDLVEWVID